ncbi:class I SAM-dependent methyltransferase [Limnoglobus roseus]|uniref:Methyltransferase n=1 Tax=Limnoglobus roseus TaxID=2598579 RepID=A0A5C1AJZ7_9BACT|nr:class I SAM-dependent methyltransferase [Limnoglobus roseus]QEL17238.1 methyltransferase [Limnoglobus roseus]
MAVAERLCRYYQTWFSNPSPEADELVALHAQEDKAAYLEKYFHHEVEKGKMAVERFLGLNREWVGGRALDFGCGAGGLTFAIREQTRSALGIDLEEYKLSFARQQAELRGTTDIDFICYPGDRIPAADSAFDVVFCVDVMEHLPKPDESLAEIRRVLKPGGLLLLSFGPPWGHPHGKHTWTRLPGWWTHLLFPQSACMKTIGLPADTTWEQLGLHRLTVSKFERLMRASGFRQLYRQYNIQRPVKWLKHVPGVRDLFISEVVAVYRK